MKFRYAILILISSIVVQTSFVRLLDLPPFGFNLALVALFLLCYYLPFEKILILAIAMGISIDLFSSISFGSTSLAAISAFSLSFYLRENILKGGRLSDLFLNSLITFFAFYLLLSAADIFLRPSADTAGIFNLIDFDLIKEILLNCAACVFAFYLAEYYKNRKRYGYARNIKISS